MSPFKTRLQGRSRRRGATATYSAITLPLMGMAAAIGIESVYLNVVHVQLQGVSDAAAHAASLRLDNTLEGMDAARAEAVSVVQGMRVNGAGYTLDPTDVEFGYWDEDALTFVPSSDPNLAEAVRVPLTVNDVGLGIGGTFFDKTWPVSSCSAARKGPGDANTGEIDGPGVRNGHFDFDTTDPRHECPGDTVCTGTTQHFHEFDNNFDVTMTDAFSDLGDQLPITGCTDDGGSIVDCSDPDGSRVIPDVTQQFKIIVVNADLSPGLWITINGDHYDVTDYDEIAFEDLETYTLYGGFNVLNELSMNFEIDAIANCELLPTNTGDVRANTPGIDNEWRSGALTLQLVRADATPTLGLGAGGHQPVTTENNGLLWESTYFWHWNGPSFIEDKAVDWQDDFDQLDCGGLPEFIDSIPGGSSC